MTTSGEPPSGAGGGVGEPDWIDQILERATKQVDSTGAGAPAMPIVPEPPSPPQQAVPQPTVASPSVAAASIGSAQPQQPSVRMAPQQADGLAEIQWVDARQVTPASTPITPSITELVPEAVGRSAWDQDLASVGETDPEGWDKLSWQDLDDKNAIDSEPLQEETSFGRLLREWGPVLFLAVAIALFTRLVLVQAYHIPSESMVPTLEDGDRVVVNRLSYQFGEIERGQVVVFAKPRGTDGENDLIKRVIGLPGETVRLVDNQVFIDGLRVEEPYLLEQDSTRPRLTIPNCSQADPASDLCVIPEDHVFVMGDNRLGSSDSRVFGPVPTNSIVGRAFLRVWPLNNLGQL